MAGRVTYRWVDARGRRSSTPVALITVRCEMPLVWHWEVSSVRSLFRSTPATRPGLNVVPDVRLGHGSNLTRRIATRRALELVEFHFVPKEGST